MLSFLNQVRTWFLRIASVCECIYACVLACVCVCVCPPPRLLITSGVLCCDIDPYDWLNKLYGFCMAAVVSTGSGRDVSIYTRHED